MVISEPFEDFLEKQLYYKLTIEATAEAYLSTYSLTLAREASSDEDHTLDAFNLFQIRDPDYIGDKVVSLTLKTENFTSDGTQLTSSKTNMFNPCYYKLCEKDELFIHNLDFEPHSNDTFLFEMVFFDEIYKATEFMVTLVPFICLFSNPLLDRQNILDAENCI